jgi:hypothetical protein
MKQNANTVPLSPGIDYLKVLFEYGLASHKGKNTIAFPTKNP